MTTSSHNLPINIPNNERRRGGELNGNNMTDLYIRFYLIEIDICMCVDLFEFATKIKFFNNSQIEQKKYVWVQMYIQQLIEDFIQNSFHGILIG